MYLNIGLCVCTWQSLGLYTGLSNDVYMYKVMYIKSVSSFVERVHGLNAGMCCLCACVCVCKPICVLYMYS